MKARATLIVLVLLAAAFAIRLPALTCAQPRPSLETDQALYTVRDKQVVLRGTIYNASVPFVVWLQTPLDVSARRTNVTFRTLDSGEIPPAVALPIEPNSPLGTYLVSVSNSTEMDTAIVRAHYGIWGPERFVYQRTDVVETRGGGVLPKASLKVTIRNPAGDFVHDVTVAANDTGSFLATWKIPPDAMTESYTLFIDGLGTYDSPDREFVSISKFSVTPALLNVTVLTQPKGPYQRTQMVSAEFVVRYPDQTPVSSIRPDLRPVALYAGQFRISNLLLVASANASGVWAARFNIPKNASLDFEYRFVIPAKAFDDGNANLGSASDVETATFNLIPAGLQVRVILNSTSFEAPFDTMTAYIQAQYPDGRPVENATVAASLSASGSRFNVAVTHDELAATWIAVHYFSFGDLLKPGIWDFTASVMDLYGNAGSTSRKFSVEPYRFLAILLVAVVVILVVRWFLLRFWQRLYLGGKRLVSTIRGRLKSPGIGRYLSDSPVTP